jgi:hypothetical protein
MKLLIQITLLLTVMLALGNTAEAASKKTKRVRAERVTKKTEAKGIETYGGRIVKLTSIKKRLFRKKNIAEILRRGQIELSNGEILYPEEVEFALVPASQRAEFNNVRIPKDDERAPKDDDGRAPRDDD